MGDPVELERNLGSTMRQEPAARFLQGVFLEHHRTNALRRDAQMQEVTEALRAEREARQRTEQDLERRRSFSDGVQQETLREKESEFKAELERIAREADEAKKRAVAEVIEREEWRRREEVSLVENNVRSAAKELRQEMEQKLLAERQAAYDEG